MQMVGDALDGRTRVARVGLPEIARHAVPVGDLRGGKGVGFVIRHPACERLAVAVVELRRQFADDARFTLRGELRQREVRPNERRPVTHRPSR